MADQTCVNAQHATLSGTTADSVTFSGSGSDIAVTNRDSSVLLYFRVDGTTAVAAADETFVVLPLQTKILRRRPSGLAVVSIVGNGNSYSAELW